jgi:hypothetical protein
MGNSFFLNAEKFKYVLFKCDLLHTYFRCWHLQLIPKRCVSVAVQKVTEV